MPKRFAVIGKPIAHSLSPKIHQYFAEQTQIDLIYETLLGDEQQFEQQVSNFFAMNGKGLNVTLPFKQRAYHLAKVHSPRCALAQAANTLWMENNQLHADNTDGVGFITDLSRYIEPKDQHILILGAGGAARGIIAPLLSAKPASLTVANRNEEKAHRLQNIFPEVGCLTLNALNQGFNLIINATSASLTAGFLDLPAEIFVHQPFCYDLTYQLKTPTAFVNYAKQRHCRAVDGIGMLIEQAAEAFALWNGVRPSTASLLLGLKQQAFTDYLF